MITNFLKNGLICSRDTAFLYFLLCLRFGDFVWIERMLEKEKNASFNRGRTEQKIGQGQMYMYGAEDVSYFHSTFNIQQVCWTSSIFHDCKP